MRSAGARKTHRRYNREPLLAFEDAEVGSAVLLDFADVLIVERVKDERRS
jgi:hypothetical protein